jgi:hypothetical protein
MLFLPKEGNIKVFTPKDPRHMEDDQRHIIILWFLSRERQKSNINRNDYRIKISIFYKIIIL